MQKLGIKYGVICGLVYVVFGLVTMLMGTAAQSMPLVGLLLGLVLVVATFFVIFYGVKDFRDNVNNGALTVGEAVKLGALIALIAALMSAAFSLLYNYVIDPGYTDRYLAEMRDMWEDKGMSDEQINQALKWSSFAKKPVFGAAFVIVWYSLWGIIKGLISGALLKKEPSSFE